jgi:undecaprenyl-phosphate galactose phosphotransferase
MIFQKKAEFARFGVGVSPQMSAATPLSINRQRSGGPWLLVKRIVDVVLATTALALLSPVLVLILVAVALDGGPAIFGHRRIGRFGRTFNCLKFRSMIVDSQSALSELLARDPQAAAEWAATQKLRNDPRITAIGRFLRVTSLDELPQLLNIIRGDMSLVGPRPIVEAEIRHYGRAFRHYLSVRPGLTGAWQISGRSDVTYAQRVRLDTEYALGWSVWGDLRIMMMTVPAVVLRRGAV